MAAIINNIQKLNWSQTNPLLDLDGWCQKFANNFLMGLEKESKWDIDLRAVFTLVLYLYFMHKHFIGSVYFSVCELCRLIILKVPIHITYVLSLKEIKISYLNEWSNFSLSKLQLHIVNFELQFWRFVDFALFDQRTKGKNIHLIAEWKETIFLRLNTTFFL